MLQEQSKTALILIADGSEEIEFVTCYDGKPFFTTKAEQSSGTANMDASRKLVLVRAGIDVKSVGVNLKNEQYATCSRGVHITPDIATISTVAALPTPDMLVLPGGLPGSETFRSTPAVLNLVRQCYSAGAYIAFICAATIALVAAFDEPIKEARVTSHPSVMEEIKEKGWRYREERVVISENVVTSRGPGTAMSFALTLVELLLGGAKRDEISAPMMLAEKL